MWLFSGKVFWIPIALFFIVFLFYKNKKRWKEGLLVLGAIILVVTFCDQFASGLCKPFFTRLRPTHHTEFMNEVHTVFNYKGGQYGFISSHAANAFGFATLTALIFRYSFYSIAIFTWALINSYSRIYLGVHFISDVAAGILAGLIFGWLCYRIYIVYYNKVIIHKNSIHLINGQYYTTYSHKRINVIIYILLFTIATMTTISLLYCYNIISPVTIK
jgi:undecaprenyl-diphosphatase